MASEDFGRDLNSVLNLQKKHNILEADFLTHQDRIENLAMQSEKFDSEGHFDAEAIKKRQAEVAERYEALKAPIQERRKMLGEAYNLHQFFRDVEDEEDWIREKDNIASSTNIGELVELISFLCVYLPTFSDFNRTTHPCLCTDVKHFI